MNSFLSDLIRVGASKLAVIFFGLGTSMVTAHFLTPQENGLIATLLVYPSLFMVLGSLGIRQSTTFFVGKGIYSVESIKNAVTQIWIITSILSVLGCFFLFYFFSKSINDTSLIFISIASIPFSLHNTYCSGVFLGENKIKDFNKINWIPSFVIFLTILIFLFFSKLEVFGVMLSYLFGNISVFIALTLNKKKLVLKKAVIEKEIIKKMLGLGMIYALALLVINLNYKIDVVILENISDSYQLGIYSKGASIVQYLWQIPMLFSTIVFARSATSKDADLFSIKVVRLLRVSLVIVSFVAMIMFFGAKFIVSFLFGNQFEESVSVMRFLLPGVVLLTIFKVMNMDLAGKGKPWIAAKSMFFPLIINILLNFYFIPKYGADGAALSSLISYSFASFFFLYFYSKETGISILSIFNYKKSDFDSLRQIVNKLFFKEI